MGIGIQHSVDASPQFVDQVFKVLLESISSGTLKPGERIRQNELAERLGVSRQPVSHALQMLKHQGLVRDAGKQGLEVAPIDVDYLLHLYRARTALEGTAVSLAASRVANNTATTEQIQELEGALTAGRVACTDGSPLPVLVRADYRFHQALYLLSANPAVVTMMTAQWPHLMRSMMAVLDDPGVPTRAWEEHGLIAQAVLAGSVDDALDLSTRHLQRAAADWHQRLSEVFTRASPQGSNGWQRVAA